MRLLFLVAFASVAFTTTLAGQTADRAGGGGLVRAADRPSA
jgi:hypothetical protein